MKSKPNDPNKEADYCKQSLLLIVLAFLAYAIHDTKLSNNTPKPIRSSLTKPEPLIKLGSALRELNLSPIEQSYYMNIFNANLIETSIHNLAAIFGLETYYYRQTLSERSMYEPITTNSHGMDVPVSTSEPDLLETGNPVSKWFNRMLKGDAHYEIPDFPLDQQPDPTAITHIDADLRNCTNGIRNQGRCGACYAFSWIALAEWHYCKQTGRLVDFSEQHIVDCGYLVKLDGCREGYLMDVRGFLHVYGVYNETDYPYRAKLGQCKAVNAPIKLSIRDFLRIKVDRLEWEQILEEQPILVEVFLPKDINRYHRGIHPGNNCDESIAHGMLLVGHGRQEGVPYWILKNSMGEDWGENGYLRLSRDGPMQKCFHNGFVSKFKFDPLDEKLFEEAYREMQVEPTWGAGFKQT